LQRKRDELCIEVFLSDLTVVHPATVTAFLHVLIKTHPTFFYTLFEAVERVVLASITMDIFVT
jgi:hypothetical protein